MWSLYTTFSPSYLYLYRGRILKNILLPIPFSTRDTALHDLSWTAVS